MKKRILIVTIIIVIAITGFVLSRDMTSAPTNGNSANVQSEINNITNSNGNQAQPAANNNVNNNNNQTMQLEIKTTQEGTGDRVVKSGDTISVLYTGKLTDGTVFDSTANRGNQPFTFTVGQGQVIQGWEQGFIGAKVGEKRTLTIPANLGYGAAGAPGAIPPNATLIFDVELVSIK